MHGDHQTNAQCTCCLSKSAYHGADIQRIAVLLQSQSNLCMSSERYFLLMVQRAEERLSNARAQRNRLLAAFEGIHAAEDDMEAVIAR